MSFRHGVFGVVLLFGFIANTWAAIAPVLVDFDGLTPDVELASYTEAGITFSAPHGLLVQPSPNPVGQVGIIGQRAAIGQPFQLIRADFTSFANDVRVEIGDSGVDVDFLVLRAFDANDLLVDEDSATLFANDPVGFKTLSVAGRFEYVLFGSEGPAVTGSSVVADNFFATVHVVPLPGALLLLLGAIPMVAFVGKGRGNRSLGLPRSRARTVLLHR